MCKITSCCCCKLPVAVIVQSAILLALSVGGMALSGSLAGSLSPSMESNSGSNQTESIDASTNATLTPFYAVSVMVCLVYALLGIFSLLGILATIKRITWLLQAYYVMLVLQAIFFSVAGVIVGLLTFLLWFLLIFIPGVAGFFVPLVLINIITFCIVIPAAVCVTSYRSFLFDGAEPKPSQTIIMATYPDPEYNIAVPTEKYPTITTTAVEYQEATSQGMQHLSSNERMEQPVSPDHQYNYPSFTGPPVPTQPRGPPTVEQTSHNDSPTPEQQQNSQGYVGTREDYLTMGTQQEHLVIIPNQSAPYYNIEEPHRPLNGTNNIESTSQDSSDVYLEPQEHYEQLSAAKAGDVYETLP
ncbi:unnamed protein product [Owenia fusiformis]|uniref:Uncharacterized protein n=1 Tax=Owenia fusiformis TaxID=6347 RepID=A0A8S4N518_OWEFU|nr:unnamed protein product [Owenia fusiformis]